MDDFTRFVNLYTLKAQRATTVAQCISEDYIKQRGVPEIIHTDQGRQFESDLIKHLCIQLGIEKTHTSPYHAQCDGMVERLNRTLKDQLAKYIFFFFFFVFFFGLSVAQITHVSTYAWLYYHHSQPFFFFFKLNIFIIIFFFYYYFFLSFFYFIFLY